MNLFTAGTAISSILICVANLVWCASKEAQERKRMKKTLILLICMMLLCVGCGNKAGESTEDSSDAGASIEIEASNHGAKTSDTDKTDQAVTGADQSRGSESEGSEEAASAAGIEADTDAMQPEGDLNGRDLFADYIMGRGAAVVSRDFLSAMNMTEIELKPGDEYTVSELESLLQKDPIIGSANPRVSYAPLSIHDGALYAMRLEYESDAENITETMIFSDHSGKLEMIFAIDSWSRRYATVNKEGVVFDDGSNGAGSHSYVTYAPDRSFVYRKVADLDEEYYGFGFYDEEGAPSETVNAIMNEAGEGNEKAADVVYYREIIDGKRYYYFLKGTEKLTQDTVEYIDKIAASHNFAFDGKTAADEARNSYEKQLGVEEACQSKEEADWKTL